MSGKQNFKKIETEYITGNMSLTSLAKKYDIPADTLKKRSQKGKWSSKRKEYKEKVIGKTVEKIAEGTSEKLKKEYDVACRMCEVLEEALQDDEQFYRHVDKYGQEDVLKTLDAKRLSAAAKALKELTEIKKFAGNLISEFEERKLEIEERKIKIAESKIPGKDDESNNINVNIEII